MEAQMVKKVEPEIQVNERYLKPIEVARMRRCSRATVYRWIEKGVLPATQHKPYRVPAAAVLRFLAEEMRV